MNINEQGTILEWKAEDTIEGQVVLEGSAPEGFALQAYLKANLPVCVSWLEQGDIDEIQILEQEQGADWAVLSVDITPTEAAGLAWANRIDEQVQWTVYHSL